MEWGRVGLVALVLGLVWLRVIPPVHRIDLVAIGGLLIGGYPTVLELYHSGIDAIRSMYILGMQWHGPNLVGQVG